MQTDSCDFTMLATDDMRKLADAYRRWLKHGAFRDGMMIDPVMLEMVKEDLVVMERELRRREPG